MPSTVERRDPLSSETHPARFCVLYIDDDTSRVGLMRDLLADEDIELSTAPSAELGIEFALAHRPDLIIVELELPRLSGSEAIAIFRELEDTVNIPIVALTSADRQSVPGLSMYCRRPLQDREFTAMVLLLARSRRGQRPARAVRRTPSARPSPVACGGVS
jgi:DNA-binding response OmpR family regulator